MCQRNRKTASPVIAKPIALVASMKIGMKSASVTASQVEKL